MSTYQEGVIGYSNQLLADPNSGIRGNGYQMDWTKVPDKFRSTAFPVTLTANAAQDATALAVSALPNAVKAGQLLDFGSAKGFAKVTADAVKGATALTVAALPAALTSGQIAYVGGSGPKIVRSGTVMGVITNGAVSLMSPRVAVDNPADGILIEDVVEGNPVTGYTGHGLYEGGYFWENRLPDAVALGGSLPSALKTELGPRFLFKMAGNNAPTLP